MKIALSPTKEESKGRNDAMDAAREGTLWKIVQTSPHARPRRRQEKQKAKPSQQSRLGMVHHDDEAQHKRGNDKSSSSCSYVCLKARGNKSSSESENDDDLPSLNELVKANVVLSFALANKRK